MKIIITTLGSDGDIFPFIGIGLELQKRGHSIIFLTSDYYREMIPKYGFTFIPIDDYSDAEEMFTSVDPENMMDQFPKHLEYFITSPMKKVYEAIEKNYDKNTVLINWKLMAGAKIASEKFNIPLVSIYLSPSQIRSVIEPPRYTFSKILPLLPKFVIRQGYIKMDQWIDSLIKETINTFRTDVGLEQIETSMLDWLETPDRLLAVFPEWFGNLQKDWPAHSIHTTFPLFVESKAGKNQEALEQFITHEKKPVVVTPGSQLAKAHEFFKVMTNIVKKLQLRGIFRTKYREQLPEDLGDTILHIEYADFEKLLPQSALIIHHGGIGTVAQAIKSGIPQIIIPWGLDQYDNAIRIKKLGIGDYIDPKKIDEKKISKKITRLLESKQVAANCKKYAESFREVDPFKQTCDIIETMIH